MRVANLTIGRTWNGAPLPERERAYVSLKARVEHLQVRIDAPYHGDPPPAAPSGPTPRLWEHEAIELFLAPAGSPEGPVPYTEIELGPHGHYLVLRLRGVRQVIDDAIQAPCGVAILGDRWRGALWLPWALVPETPLRANAYAVHGRPGARRHEAAEPVPGPEPDFHRLDRFVPLPLLRPIRR